MRRFSRFLLFLTAALASTGASRAQQQPPAFVQVVDDFTRGSGGWLVGFADYELAQGGMDRLAELRNAPDDGTDQDTGGRAFFVQSMNRSDDLFMFLKKPLGLAEGIAPDAFYEVEFFVEMYSAEPSGCAGVGGSSGDSVYFKVGAHADEPVALLADDGLRLNLDKGNQSQDGPDATVAGTIANGLPCTDENRGRFVKIERRHTHPHPVRSSPSGELWIFVGTDSAYEGLTQLYYSRIAVTLTLVEGNNP